MLKKQLITKISCVAVCGILCSCGLTDWIKPSEENSSTAETTTTTTTERKIETTRVSKGLGKVDKNDEDMEGYTTTTEITGGTLENSFETEEYDKNIRATMTSRTTQSETSATTSRKFNSKELYPLDASNKYKKAVKYQVNSDTTYLNLRYGPSKKYSVQLKIPNKTVITATGETLNETEGTWVFVSYNKKSGWVMKSLLKKL